MNDEYVFVKERLVTFDQQKVVFFKTKIKTRSLPLTFWLAPFRMTISWPSSLRQVTRGWGNPRALQDSRAEPPSGTSVSPPPSSFNISGGTTTSREAVYLFGANQKSIIKTSFVTSKTNKKKYSFFFFFYCCCVTRWCRALILFLAKEKKGCSIFHVIRCSLYEPLSIRLMASIRHSPVLPTGEGTFSYKRGWQKVPLPSPSSCPYCDDDPFSLFSVIWWHFFRSDCH